MIREKMHMRDKAIEDFFIGKSDYTRELFLHFIQEFNKIGTITLHPAKTMIGISNTSKRIAYVTQLGKNFVHIVFPFKMAYSDNLCFQKIAQVPGDAKQFNHHFRMLAKTDVNKEIKKFMAIAYEKE
jgi:hypothetical protein